MKCPGCGSALFDGDKCGACGRLGTDTSPRAGSTPVEGTALGCVAVGILGAVLLLHFFADRISGQGNEPAVLRWIVIGFGCLILIGKVYLLVAGKGGERIYALVYLVIVALLIVAVVFF